MTSLSYIHLEKKTWTPLLQFYDSHWYDTYEMCFWKPVNIYTVKWSRLFMFNGCSEIVASGFHPFEPWKNINFPFPDSLRFWFCLLSACLTANQLGIFVYLFLSFLKRKRAWTVQECFCRSLGVFLSKTISDWALWYGRFQFNSHMTLQEFRQLRSETESFQSSYSTFHPGPGETRHCTGWEGLLWQSRGKQLAGCFKSVILGKSCIVGPEDR